MEITADTQAILLLLSRLGQPKPRTAPLSSAEYDRLAAWLHQREMRPRDLLQATFIAEVPPSVGDAARIKGLLERGGDARARTGRLGVEGSVGHRARRPGLSAAVEAKAAPGSPTNCFSERAPVMTSTAEASPSSAHGRQTRRPWSSPGSSRADREGLNASLESGGRAVAVLPGDLERSSFDRALRGWIEAGRLTLLSPYYPDARFTVWNAMDRNKDVYALSDCGVVVSSDYDKGGTWAGAMENLKAGWVPLFVRRDPHALPGNEQLLRRGGIPVVASELEGGDWAALLRAKASAAPTPPEQPELPI